MHPRTSDLLSPLWRRARGEALAYACYAAVILAAICGLWAMGAYEYNVRLERLQSEAADETANIQMLVASSVDHIDLLRHQAEALLSETSASFASRRLFAAMAGSHDFSGYALDTIPRGVDPRTVANLTGDGALPVITTGAAREILMALDLNPMMDATRRQIPEAASVYYVSANRFISLQPWIPSGELHWDAKLLGRDLYALGKPEHNADRNPFWTDLNVDRGDLVTTITVGAPVYDKSGRFRGTIDLDLKLDTIAQRLKMDDFGNAWAMLITDRNRVMADSTGAAAPSGTLTDLADILPKSDALLGAVSAQPTGTFAREENWLVHSTAVKGAPWRLVVIADRDTLIVEVLRAIWIGIAALVLLAIALIAVEQRRRAGVALAENVRQLRGVSLNLAAARDEARQANNAKSMLLANVSHELRTPLNAIIGFSDMMRHRVFGPLGDPKYEGYADDIQRSGKLLLDLINDLLDITKLESGHYELVETECDLRPLLEEAANLVKLQAEQADVAVKVCIAGILPPVLADQRALRQILLNLLSNAIKFTPPKGTVRLACALVEGRPVITVEDTGRGIAADEMRDLFRPFARTAEAKKASTPGTGLGLAIVKSLVELHQGSIALESRLGFGTTVTVKLPAARVIAARLQGAA